MRPVGRSDRRAKFCLKVFNELKSRGCQDILIAVVDGLKGLADAINTAFPRTAVQTCIVHLIRNSLDYAGWKDRKAAAAALSSTRPLARRRPSRRCGRSPMSPGEPSTPRSSLPGSGPERTSRRSSSSRRTSGA